MEGASIKNIYYSVDYWHVNILMESIESLGHECFTVCFRDCNIIKWSFESNTINLQISKINVHENEDGRAIVHILSEGQGHGELVLSYSDIVKMEK